MTVVRHQYAHRHPGNRCSKQQFLRPACYLASPQAPGYYNQWVRSAYDWRWATPYDPWGFCLNSSATSELRGGRQMQWTPELDKAIAELHAKRPGNPFIPKRFRLKPSHVRAPPMEPRPLK